jgi:hypothetical protein
MLIEFATHSFRDKSPMPSTYNLQIMAVPDELNPRLYEGVIDIMNHSFLGLHHQKLSHSMNAILCKTRQDNEEFVSRNVMQL